MICLLSRNGPTLVIQFDVQVNNKVLVMSTTSKASRVGPFPGGCPDNS
jgi:hypothetical protein